MALTDWNPNTTVTRGNVAVRLAPAIADINAPKVTELSTGMSIECSITDFVASSSVNSESVDWLCNPVSETLPGSTEHSIEDVMIKVNGQTDDALYTQLAPGDVTYIWRRDGMPHDTAVAAGQYVWVWRVQCTGVDPMDASNAYAAINAHFTVLDRTSVPVLVVA